MDSLNDLVQAVKQFRDHNASRESRRLNRLIDLGGLNKAIQTLEQTAQVENPDTEHITASIKLLNDSLTTFGQSSGRRDLREESGDLRNLIRCTENIQKATNRVLARLGTTASPLEIGRLIRILTQIIQALHRRMSAVDDLEKYRI